MKMNYLLDNKTIFKNRQRQGGNLPPVIILFIIIFLLVLGGVLFRPLSNFFLGGTGQIFWLNTKIGQSFSLTLDFLQTKKTLVHENENLKNSLSEARRDLFIAQNNLDRLVALNSILPRPNVVDDFVLATVVATPGFLPYDVFLVNINEDNLFEVTIGNKVRQSGSFGLGEVVAVSGRTAKVKLYSSAGTRLRAFVGPDNVPAIIYGRGGGNFTITLPRVIEVPIHSNVYLQGEPDKIIGIVETVTQQPENPSQIIYVKTPINIYNLRWVEIYEQ